MVRIKLCGPRHECARFKRGVEELLALLGLTEPKMLVRHYHKGGWQIMNQNVSMPTGPNQVTVKVYDGSNPPIEITGNCTLTAVASDATVIQNLAPVPASPNVFSFTAAAGTATITYVAADVAGSITETDNVTAAVPVPGPVSLSVSYQFGTVSPAPTLAPAPTT